MARNRVRLFVGTWVRKYYWIAAWAAAVWPSLDFVMTERAFYDVIAITYMYMLVVSGNRTP